MYQKNQKLINFTYFVLFVILLILVADISFAGTTGTEFDSLVAKLKNWAEGGLGRAVSLAAVIVGAIGSVVRSNPMPILSGIAFAMILSFTPGIVTGLLSGII